MSAPFKVTAQAKAKGEKIKAGKRVHEAKKKQAKSAASSKAKGTGAGSAAAVQPAAEKIVQQPEAAGEDDHAFFDDEDNADYAKFMLSLDSSGLTTFSKRTKDRVAVPPTSKKKSKQLKQASKAAPPTPPPQRSAGASDGSKAAAGVDDAPPDAAATKAPPAKKAKKEAVVDAKRRQASTAGWAVEDSGPARLPIKTRRGLLKPNERMQQQQQEQQPGDAPSKKAGSEDGQATANGGSTGKDVDAAVAAAVAGEVEGNSENEHDNGGGDDVMSESDASVYDSGDDSGAEYSMDDFDDSAAGGTNGGRASVGDGDVSGGRKVDLAVLRQRRFEQKKALMGELCESILAAPEESLVRPKTVVKGEDERSRMEQLFALVEDDDHRVCHLALLSQYAVFKDIIPGYRIRVPTAAEMATKVSKDVHRMRAQEAALLKAYQGYLKALEAAVQAAVSPRAGGASASGARALAAAAIRCMCGLLSAHPHFNFRSNLVRAVVAGTNHKLADVREACCTCLGGVFAEDTQGEVSLEVTKAVAKFIKERKYHVSEGTLKCLSALPLRIREDERARAKARVKSKNRKRRRDGTVEAGLMEADARVDDDVRAKCQADALHEVMLTYFRVLKRRPPPPALFPAVMEGLAKFVHLVNLDTVQDLLDLLKDLLSEDEDEEELPLEAALHCILAAFRALQGPGRELQTDEAAFVSALYRRLPDLLRPENGDASGRKTASCVALVYDCLDAALGKRRELSTARVSAMIKRLLSVSLQMTQSANPAWGLGAGGLLRGAHRLLLRYPAAQQLLENEQDRPGSGPYRPDLTNPEHANALSSAAWELSLLRNSSEPAIAAVAADIVALGSQDAASGLAALYERGREAREAGAGQGILAAVFAGVPLPEGRAVALGKTSLLEAPRATEDATSETQKKEGKGAAKKQQQQQQRKRAVPKDGVDIRSPLLVRLARASET
ncbi:unnamed protein product [Scytosiphon promiscuus]